LLVALLFFILIVLTLKVSLFKDPAVLFIFLQFYFLLLGSLHLYFMNKKLEWSSEDSCFLQQLLFTLTRTLFGCICFLLLFRFINPDIPYLIVTSILFFIIPFFFFNTFQKAIAIPSKLLKKWFLPINEKIEPLDEREWKNLLLISFEIQKQSSDSSYSNIPATIPLAMEFGKLFYYFSRQYNERSKNGKIQLTDEYGEPQGWLFFKKRKWYTLHTRYIDPEQPIYKNNIRVNNIIICKRTI
jgi:hypothetical protein